MQGASVDPIMFPEHNNSDQRNHAVLRVTTVMEEEEL